MAFHRIIDPGRGHEMKKRALDYQIQTSAICPIAKEQTDTFSIVCSADTLRDRRGDVYRDELWTL